MQEIVRLAGIILGEQVSSPPTAKAGRQPGLLPGPGAGPATTPRGNLAQGAPANAAPLPVEQGSDGPPAPTTLAPHNLGRHTPPVCAHTAKALWRWDSAPASSMMCLFIIRLDSIGGARVLMGNGAFRAHLPALAASSSPRGAAPIMANLAIRVGFPSRQAADVVWLAGETGPPAHPIFVFSALASSDSLTGYPWGRWASLDELAVEDCYLAAGAAIQRAYQISTPRGPLFTKPLMPAARAEPSPARWADDKAAFTTNALALRQRLEAHPSARIREWAGSVAAGMPEDFPEAARGVLLAQEQSLANEAFSCSHPRFHPPVTTAPRPAQPQACSEGFGSWDELYTPEALRQISEWLDAEARDLTALGANRPQRSHRSLYLGPDALQPRARGLVICTVGPPPWFPADFTLIKKERINSRVFKAMVGNDFADQALLAGIRDGFPLFPEPADGSAIEVPYYRTALNPALRSLCGNVAAISNVYEELLADGHTLANAWPAYVPINLVPPGAAAKKGGDLRRIGDAGNPRQLPVPVDSSGVPVRSINERSDIHGTWPNGDPKYPPEVKPSPRDAKRDAAILRLAGSILGEQVYAYSDDFRRFFHQFHVLSRDSHLLNAAFLTRQAAEAAAAGAPAETVPARSLIYYHDNSLSMGLAVSSGYAQRFSTPVAQIVLRALDDEEKRIVDVALACPQTPTAHRNFYRARRTMGRKLGINGDRLVSLMIYTDDSIAMACGADRLVRTLVHWTRTVDALDLDMAASHKRVISQTATFIGFGLAFCLGFAYIPAAKVSNALCQLDRLLSGEPVPASDFRSLTGLLIHFQCILDTPGSALYAFHTALAAAGNSPATIIERTAALAGAARQWTNMLAMAAVAAFCPLIADNVPTPFGALDMFCDASQTGSFCGLGGYLGGHHWRAQILGVHRRCIALLEFIALIVSVQTFRPHIGGANVTIHVDNSNVCSVANGHAHSDSTRRAHAALLACPLMQGRTGQVRIVYIRSESNVVADALSRNRMDVVSALLRAANVTAHETAPVGGQTTTDQILGSSFAPAQPIEPLAAARLAFRPTFRPPSIPISGLAGGPAGALRAPDRPPAATAAKRTKDAVAEEVRFSRRAKSPIFASPGAQRPQSAPPPASSPPALGPVPVSCPSSGLPRTGHAPLFLSKKIEK